VVQAEHGYKRDDDGAGSASVVIDTHVQAAWVDTLEVSVEHVLEIVEVVVLRADGIVVGERDGQSIVPSIVVAHGRGEIAIVLVEDSLEVPRANANVDFGIVAVCAVGGALVGGDLHHADFGGASRDGGVAAGFLEGNRGEEDGGHAGFGGHAFEDVEVRCAGGEDAVIVLEDGGQVLVDEVLERDWGWHPACSVNTAVEPVLVAVGSAGGLWLGCSIGGTALPASSYDDARVGRSRARAGAAWLFGA